MSLARPLAATALLLAALGARPGHAGYTLDGSFSFDGMQTVPFDQSAPFADRLVRVLRTADGRYVSVGTASIGNGRIGIALSRHLANGTLDTTFAPPNGKRVKDACMTAVNDAILDAQGRIVVVGDSDCSADGSIDGAVVRFAADGADDVTFGGDGGITFTFSGAAGAEDHGEGVILDGVGGNLIVGGSYRNGPTTRSVYLIRVVSNGFTANPTPTLTFSTDTHVVRGLADGAQSLWLVRAVGADQGTVGYIYRIDPDLTRDMNFASDGVNVLTHFPSSGHVACGVNTSVYSPTALARIGTQVVTFATVLVGLNVRTQFVAMNATTGGDYRSGCLNGTDSTSISVFDALPDADATALYAATGSGFPGRLGLWKLVPDPGLAFAWRRDPDFNDGQPLTAVFAADTNVAPAGRAHALLRDGTRFLVAGLRVFNGDDTDGALARFDDLLIFDDGFE